MNYRILCAVFALLISTVPALARDDPAKTRLKDLQVRVIKQEFADDKLRLELLTFCRDQVGTPLYKHGIDALRPCPAPLDRLDANSIDAEDRKYLSIGALVGYMRPHNRDIASIAFSFDGSLLASSSWDSKVVLFKLGGKEPEHWTVLDGSPSGIALSPDCKLLATGCLDTHVIVWDVTGKEPKQEHKLSGHKNRPFALAFAPKGKLLASGCFGPVLRISKLDDLNPEVVAVLADDKTTARGIMSLAYSHDGKYLVAGNRLGKQSLYAWDVSGPELKAKAIPAAEARVVACSPTAPIIAFAGDDAEIHLWNIGGESVEKLHRLPGHTGKAAPPIVKALAFSPNGKILASSGQDKRVGLWDVAKGESVREWQFNSEAHALAFSSDGRHLAVGNRNGTIYILRLETLKIKAD